MNVDVVVVTCGDDRWREIAGHRAAPSAFEATASDQFEFIAVHVQHHPDLTLAEARNRAAASGRFDWLCFLDADDELEPGYLDAMSAAYQQELTRSSAATETPLLIPAVRFVHEGGGRLEEARIPNKGGWPRVNEAVIGTLVNRSLFERVGGFRDRIDCESCTGTGNWTGRSGDDEHTQEGGCPDCGGTGGTAITIYEDWDLWLRCVDAGAPRVYVEDAVYRAHVNPGGGRNIAADPQPVYDAIWRDHIARANGSSVRRRRRQAR